MHLHHTLLLTLCLGGFTAVAAETEPAAILDPVEVTAEQRTENAFRTVQLGMGRGRSEKAEDADKIVCLKQKPTGSNIPVINCATNRFWEKIRASSMTNVGLVTAPIAGSGGGSAKKEDKVFTMSLTDFNKLEKRFGALPQELKDKP